MLSGNRHGLAETQIVAFQGACLAGAPFGLVRHEDHRLAGAAQDRPEDLVQRHDALARIDHEQHHVGLCDGQLGLMAHARLKALVGDVLKTGGVDEIEIQVAKATGRKLSIPGHAGPIVDDGQPTPGQAIEKRRLPDVRAGRRSRALP